MVASSSSLMIFLKNKYQDLQTFAGSKFIIVLYSAEYTRLFTTQWNYDGSIGSKEGVNPLSKQEMTFLKKLTLQNISALRRNLGNQNILKRMFWFLSVAKMSLIFLPCVHTHVQTCPVCKYTLFTYMCSPTFSEVTFSFLCVIFTRLLFACRFPYK